LKLVKSEAMKKGTKQDYLRD